MRCLKLPNGKSLPKNSNTYASFFTFLNFTLKVATGSVKLYHLVWRYYSRHIKMIIYNKKCARGDINISLNMISRMPVIPRRFKKIGEVAAGDSILRCYKDGADSVYVLDGYSYLVANMRKGDFSIFLKKMKYSGSFIKNALILFFRSKGLFALHSALVVRKNMGILLSGDSGAGKTTLSVSLKKMGFTYESDDLCLIGRDRFGLARNLVSAKGLSENIQDHSKEMLCLRAERILGVSGLRHEMCIPRIIIFLRLTSAKATKILPLTNAETLSRLIKQSLLMCFEEEAELTKHMQVLRRLSIQCRCFELLASDDKKEVRNTLISFLDELQSRLG